MTEPIHLAFVWHQHQPYYEDTLTGTLAMPWVRLHGVKDYYGLARLLERVEGMRATVNFVPSLLLQIESYLKGQKDVWQALSAMPAAELNEEQRLFVLTNFFMTNPDTMIRPYPRYFELYARRGSDRPDKRVLARFDEEDIRDLQVLANLAWMHPVSFEEEPFLAHLAEKGRDYSEEEKRRLLDIQVEILGRIVPLHRELEAAGKVELSVSPFYHPIVPLLVDERSVLEAMPGTPLPRRTESMEPDAVHQVKAAVDFHTRTFGRPPAGMWPSEGSVSQRAAELFASAGIRWIATDQEILARSASDVPPAERHPYRPYRVRGVEGELAVVFRDHELSDLLSFQYQYYREEDAVEDFLGRLRGIAERHRERPLCVFVIMDGENAWEHYRRTAEPFLTRLFERLAEADFVRPTTVGAFLEEHPPERGVDRLAAGSWINGNFAIWAGHPEDLKAWEYLDAVRTDLLRKTRNERMNYGAEAIRAAWEEIYIAEGSDYFWWYGEDHTSSQDMEFDALFRLHLKNVYRHLGESYPNFLDEPVKKKAGRKPYSEPASFLEVQVDGRVTSFFEWRFAGRYDPSADFGAMARAALSRISNVMFGFGRGELFVRVDFGKQGAAEGATLALEFRKPGTRRFYYPLGRRAETLFADPECTKPAGRAAFDRVFEGAVPLEALGAAQGDEVEFHVLLLEEGRTVEILPRGGAFALKVPGEEFDALNWSV